MGNCTTEARWLTMTWLPLSLGEVAPRRGDGEGNRVHPRSQKSEIFASSPKGGAICRNTPKRGGDKPPLGLMG